MYTISEFGLIRRAGDFPDAPASMSEVYLADDDFESLKRFLACQDIDWALGYGWQKGKEVIRARNYAGLIETPEGVQLEILPKLARARAEDARLALLRMLRYLPDSPFRQSIPARSGAEKLPLWELFIEAFLDEVTALVSQGLQRAYVSEQSGQPYLRGKLHLPEQIRRNTRQAGQFAVICDEFTAALPPNRLLKTTLLYLQNRSRSTRNQSRVRQLLFAFDEVPASSQLVADWQATRASNRLFSRYEPALRWVEVLLQSKGYGVKVGRSPFTSLLFAMERVFEAYVAAGFRQYVTRGEVVVQESSQYLIDEHGGTQRFKLRPDLVVYRPGATGLQTMVLDTKWKVIDGTDRTGTYGIDQADLYQLYAYGKKYNATELVLIYPANETFREPLTVFGYDATMRLRVVPFDVLNRLENEVHKILPPE